jgi:hypothetical protein
MKLSETLAAISKLRVDAERIGRDLHRHMAAERDPVAHAKLRRLHMLTSEMASALAMPMPAA